MKLISIYLNKKYTFVFYLSQFIIRKERKQEMGKGWGEGGEMERGGLSSRGLTVLDGQLIVNCFVLVVVCVLGE